MAGFIPWSVHLTVGSSERLEIMTMAAHEGRSAANMIRELTREARAARKTRAQEAIP